MLDNKEKVIHIINRDRFSTGYIEFMRVHFSRFDHLFVLLKEGALLELETFEDIHYVEHYRELRFDRELNRKLKECDKIIVSGVWDMTEYLYLCGKKVLSKTYFHFWGGDFYKFREFSSFDVKKSKFILKRCLLRCAGVINLIEEDYVSLKEIMGLKEIKHFVAPIGKNPKENIDYAYYRNKPRTDNKYRILLGNSATVYNQHEEMFRVLARFKDENIEIVCPLSYGNDIYREEVLKKGPQYLGDKFHPILQSIPKEEYVDFLASCDVGIFNNNRQQAMGNISIFARLGKKVYLRDDTPMWEHFKKIGYQFNVIDELKNADLDTIVHIDEDVRENNIKARERWEQQAVTLWDKVLCDQITMR